jgi:hypothetical protein
MSSGTPDDMNMPAASKSTIPTMQAGAPQYHSLTMTSVTAEKSAQNGTHSPTNTSPFNTVVDAELQSLPQSDMVVSTPSDFSVSKIKVPLKKIHQDQRK